MPSSVFANRRTVKLQGKPAAIKGANIKTSTGDEAGTAGGGLFSAKTKGKVTWLSQSMDVKFEGKGVVRVLDSNMHNGNMGNVPSPNGGQATGATGDEAKCPICGKAFEGHKNVIPPPSKQSDKAAKDVLKPDKPRKHNAKDLFPIGPDCKASLTATTNPDNNYEPPCTTCKYVLTAMLCDEGPPARPSGHSESGAASKKVSHKKLRKGKR